MLRLILPTLLCGLVTVLALRPAAASDDGLAGPSAPAPIRLSGEIAFGDEAGFARRVPAAGHAVIVLDGPGGSVDAALKMGRLIRQRGFDTLVQAGETCASACALVWLAGSRRFMGDGARVGFHSVSIAGTPVESSAGNARVASYMGALGLGRSAVAFATSAPPGGMRWLDPGSAKAIGLPVRLLPQHVAAGDP